jgi:hypothetical protein
LNQNSKTIVISAQNPCSNPPRSLLFSLNSAQPISAQPDPPLHLLPSNRVTTAASPADQRRTEHHHHLLCSHATYSSSPSHFPFVFPLPRCRIKAETEALNTATLYKAPMMTPSLHKFHFVPNLHLSVLQVTVHRAPLHAIAIHRRRPV